MINRRTDKVDYNIALRQKETIHYETKKQRGEEKKKKKLDNETLEREKRGLETKENVVQYIQLHIHMYI